MNHSNSGFKLLAKNNSVKSVLNLQKKDSMFFNYFNTPQREISQKGNTNNSGNNNKKGGSISKNKHYSKTKNTKRSDAHQYLSEYRINLIQTKPNTNIPKGMVYINNKGFNTGKYQYNKRIAYTSNSANMGNFLESTNGLNSNSSGREGKYYVNMNGDNSYKKPKKNRNQDNKYLTEKITDSLDDFDKKEREINRLKLELEGSQNNNSNFSNRKKNNSSLGIGIPKSILNNNYFTTSDYGPKRKKSAREENKSQNTFTFYPNNLNNCLLDDNSLNFKTTLHRKNQSSHRQSSNLMEKSQNLNLGHFRCFSFKNIRYNSISTSKSPVQKKTSSPSNYRTILSKTKRSSTKPNLSYNNNCNSNSNSTYKIGVNFQINHNISLEEMISSFEALRNRARRILIGYHSLILKKC
ncbi:MAG: hypothetical protein MJ252_21820 [archaeon]|nr:hypothetical protein [archaeon]